MVTDASCLICGAQPTAYATFVGHRGLLILFSFWRRRGDYCRPCGLSSFRRTTSQTLVQGWWSVISLVITPIVLVWNVFQRAKVARLGPPTPPEHGYLAPPLEPGKPLYRRPTMVGLLVPVLLLFAILYQPEEPQEHVGDCVGLFSERTVWDFVPCDSPNIGPVVAVVEDRADCPQGTAAAKGEEAEFLGRKVGGEYYCVNVIRPAS